MRFFSNTFLLSVVLALAPNPLSTTSAQADPRDNAQEIALSAVAPEVKSIIAELESAKQRLNFAHAKITYVQVIPKEYNAWLNRQGAQSRLPNEVVSEGEQRTEMSSDWSFQDKRLSVVVTLNSTPGDTLSEERHILVSDATEAKMMTERFSAPSVPKNNTTPLAAQPSDMLKAVPDRTVIRNGAVLPTDQVVQNGVWSLFASVDPRSYVFGDGNIQTVDLSRQLTHFAPHITFKGYVTHMGALCAELHLLAPDKKELTKYWFDIDHGYLLREKVGYLRDTAGGLSLIRRWVMRKIVQSGSVWFPAEVELTSYWFRYPSIKQDLSTRGTDFFNLAPMSQTVVISDFKADVPVSSSAFDLKWPPGTTVQDKIRGTKFTQPSTTDSPGESVSPSIRH